MFKLRWMLFKITNLFYKRKKNSFENALFISSLDNLNHNLQNHFVSIKAILGNIGNNIENKDLILQNINLISQCISTANLEIELTSLLLKKVEPDYFPLSLLVISNSLQTALKNFYSEGIIIKTIFEPKNTLINANVKLFNNIIYCILKNVDRLAVKNSDSEIMIIQEKNEIIFNISINTLPLDNLFSINNPDKPGNGFRFILNSMKIMSGKIDFILKDRNFVTIKLIFCNADEV